MDNLIEQVAPIPYAGTAILALLLGVLLGHSANRFGEFIFMTKGIAERLPAPIYNLVVALAPSRSIANAMAIERYGDQLEQFMHRQSFEVGLILLSLRSGKVYVGWVQSHPANLDGRVPWLSLVPFVSGFRNPDEGYKVQFTTNYAKHHKRRLDAGAETSLLKLIPVSEIVDASPFEPKIWESFQHEQ